MASFLYSRSISGLLFTHADSFLPFLSSYSAILWAHPLQHCLPYLPQTLWPPNLPPEPTTLLHYLRCTLVSIFSFPGIGLESHRTWLATFQHCQLLFLTGVNSHSFRQVDCEQSTAPGPFSLQESSSAASIPKVFCKLLLNFGGFKCLLTIHGSPL